MPMRRFVTASAGDSSFGDDEQSNIGSSTLCKLIGSCVSREVRDEAATRFADHYMEQLLRLIDRNFAVKYRRGLESEDVAQSVMKSMLIRMRDRKLTPRSGKEIWRLLCTIALNKIRNKIRNARTLKNDVGREVNGLDDDGLEFADPGDPEAVEFRDFLQSLEGELGPQDSLILMMTLEGFSVQEIADKLDISPRSVTRHMNNKIRPTVLAHLPEELWKPLAKPQDQ
jgi:RNA polymerase sigma factor (sigma-70 family)